MAYHVHRKEDADRTKKVEPWGNLSWMAGEHLNNAQAITFGRVVINKGESNPRHCHSNCEEILYLLTGKLDHSIGDDHVILNPGDTLIVKPGVFHNAVSIGEEQADMIVAYSAGIRNFELESE
jgi:quercetin dioxygenase-like cupin family protein